MPEIKAPWAVSFKEATNDEIEYSVVRIDNDHGFKSWRWIEPDRKLIVACSRDADYKYPQFLKDRLKVIAIDYANHLNEQEGQGDFNVMWHEDTKPPHAVEVVPEPLSTEQQNLAVELFRAQRKLVNDITASYPPYILTEPKDVE